jgi:hypothetical protein
MAVMGAFATTPSPGLASMQILAHQGGWDEALYVLAPLVIIGLLLLLANRRANAVRRAADAAPEPVDSGDDV